MASMPAFMHGLHACLHACREWGNVKPMRGVHGVHGAICGLSAAGLYAAPTVPEGWYTAPTVPEGWYTAPTVPEGLYAAPTVPEGWYAAPIVPEGLYAASCMTPMRCPPQDAPHDAPITPPRFIQELGQIQRDEHQEPSERSKVQGRVQGRAS